MPLQTVFSPGTPQRKEKYVRKRKKIKEISNTKINHSGFFAVKYLLESRRLAERVPSD
ncbi:21160_t:CDS:2 [Rhizophagus irregularis]|nr:21160_t:CDS:2 [Rhizophagus irregularis]